MWGWEVGVVVEVRAFGVGGGGFVGAVGAAAAAFGARFEVQSAQGEVFF